MTTLELIHALIRNSGFYWKKFFVFLILCGTVGGGLLLWHGQSQATASSAAFEFPKSSDQTYVESQTMDVVVTSNGQVTAQKKNLTSNLKIFSDHYEISILALDSPGVFVSQFQVIMHLPADVRPDQIEMRAYAVHGIESHQEIYQDSRTLVFIANNIDPAAQYTVVANLPKNILTPSVAKIASFLLDQISAQSYVIFAFGLPVLTMLILITMVVRRRQDKSFYTSKKIINKPPNNNPPAVVGALSDGKVGAREIAATLIDLAVHGYLFINHHSNGTFSFGKRKSLNLENLPELRGFERMLLSKIFEPDKYKSTGADVEMRVGRHIFSKKIAQVYLGIYNEATLLGYFAQNPVVIHLRWRYTGMISFFLSLIGFFYTAFRTPDPKYIIFFWVGNMMAASVIIWLSSLMPVRSVTGTVVLRAWMEFRQYLRLSRPIEGGANIADQFNIMLPYAMVFGLEEEWALRFLRTSFTKPEWYESDDTVLTLESFIKELYPIIEYVGSSLDKSHEPTVQ